LYLFRGFQVKNFSKKLSSASSFASKLAIFCSIIRPPFPIQIIHSKMQPAILTLLLVYYHAAAMSAPAIASIMATTASAD
jgi:hypothetical protein